MPTPDNSQKISLSDLYPNLSQEELQEAAENIRRYLAVVRQIYERSKKRKD